MIGSAAIAAVTKATMAFLHIIAFAEGTGDRYDTLYDFHVFRDFDRHPNVVIRGLPYYSSAAGRYQFIHKTFKELQKNCKEKIPDFTPTSQDSAAICLLNMKGVKHSLILETEGTFSAEVNKVNTIWASLPGSPYGQPTHSASKLFKEYRRFIDDNT